ncbi:Cys-Gln thioester bond-forming surface protein [Streptacidiphilus monticola]|uniref:Cys-Gln thioester bond-forming surface protein n=1 Tax=Streptacidiphilus monticola TaxID=2161674 RepID=A0ABW1G1P6_9ACTN
MTTGAGSVAAYADTTQDAVLVDQHQVLGEARVNGEYVEAGLMTLQVGDAELSVYCIDLKHPTGPTVHYRETSWDKALAAPDADLSKVRWVLEHGYPVKGLDALAAEAHVSGLTEQEAAVATQLAIWKFSDQADGQAVNPRGGNLDVERADAVAQWLEANATDTPQEPAPALALNPGSVKGASGDLLGPIKVATNAESVDVKLNGPAGVQLVGKNGQAVSTANDGTELYLKVPAGTAAGSAEIDASTTTSLPVGRAFNAVGDQRHQTLILAGSQPVEVDAQAKASWTVPVGSPSPSPSHSATPSATPSSPASASASASGGVTTTLSASPSASTGGGLASTGASSATPVIAGLGAALVALGGGAVFFMRKRKGARHGA